MNSFCIVHQLKMTRYRLAHATVSSGKNEKNVAKCNADGMKSSVTHFLQELAAFAKGNESSSTYQVPVDV